MKTDYVKKGLAIGIVVLFVCVGISSAVAIKGVNANNNDIINTSNVESTEDLPDLIVVFIDAHIGWVDHDNPYLFDYSTWVTIKNIGNASINGFIKLSIRLCRGIGELLDTIWPEKIWLNLAPGDKITFSFGGTFVLYNTIGFEKIIVNLNYGKYVNESNYRNNVAQQKFLHIYPYPYLAPEWIKIGSITYPILIPHQLGI